MSVSIFDGFLTTTAMTEVFGDNAVVQAMLRFEESLARAQAAEGVIPESAARAIASVCRAPLYDIAALMHASRRAGSLAIPLVNELTKTVALYDAEAAGYVHWGSTSQDVIDTAMVLVTRDALTLIGQELARLCTTLFSLAEQHADTPVLARTLMQPAQVTTLGFKFSGWLAPLVRARARLHTAATNALQLQLGGAVGTLAVMGSSGVDVAQRMAAELGLGQPDSAWHTQRDEWVALGLEVALLTGSLGKIATDLSLMAQGEIGELAEPSGAGRGGSSAMPHKRNPVAAMVALAAAQRAPHSAAALLAAMGQQHERGLGNWQAELAEWPGLFLGAHGALTALNEALSGLQVDATRMRANIDTLHGLIYAEAASASLATVVGRNAAHSIVEAASRQTIIDHVDLRHALLAAIEKEPRLHGKFDSGHWNALFDPATAARPAATLTRTQLQHLRQQNKETA